MRLEHYPPMRKKYSYFVITLLVPSFLNILYQQVHSFSTKSLGSRNFVRSNNQQQQQQQQQYRNNVRLLPNNNEHKHHWSMQSHLFSVNDSNNNNNNSPVMDEYPSAIFTQSKEEVYSLLVGDDDVRLSLEDLKRCWEELNELIEYEELLPEELDQIYNQSLEKRSSYPNHDSDEDDKKLDKDGFYALYLSIDELFYVPTDEDEEGSESSINTRNIVDDSTNTISEKTTAMDKSDNHHMDSAEASNKVKNELISALEKMTNDARNNQQLICGFDCDEKTRQIVFDLIDTLSSIESPVNQVTSNSNKKMSSTQIMGDWNLLYTCSHAMIINRSLSGLGRSSSTKAQFQGLRKRLFGSKYLGKVEYVETFGGGLDTQEEDEDVSFEVTVTGEWYIDEKRHATTGLRVPSLKVDLDKVEYGPMTNGADQWSSLGPVKLTDFLYLDDDLMILRGNANTDSLFVYRKILE